MSLEDETGVVQVICWKSLRDEGCREPLKLRLMGVYGTWQRERCVKNQIAGCWLLVAGCWLLVAGWLENLTLLLRWPASESQDFMNDTI